MFLSLIRFFFRSLGSISPKAAGHLGFLLFCTPLAPRQFNEKQRQLISEAKARLAKAERHTFSTARERVAYYRFRPAIEAEANSAEPQLVQSTQIESRSADLKLEAAHQDNLIQSKGKTVLLVHGWTSDSSMMTAFVDPLLSAGFDVIAIDLPAHGKSSGKMLEIPKACRSLAALQQQTGPWYGVIAHSFGGAATVTALSNILDSPKLQPVERMVLISAPCSIEQVFANFGDIAGLSKKSLKWMMRKTIDLTGRPIGDFHGRNLLGNLGISTLVMHDPEDKEVSFDNAEMFRGAGDFVKVEATQGLGHRRIVLDRAVAERAAGFIGIGS